MNKKWSEKTTLEKTMDIVSGIALAIWVISQILERTNKIQNVSPVSNIAIFVICACEAVSFWNVKRALSYVAIGGMVLMAAVFVLEMSLLA